jgi:CheY-like chemotaxis protein
MSKDAIHVSFVKPSILICDDTPANLIALRALLEDMDCNLVTVNSGNDALKSLLKHEFALILLDVQMPEMDGYEVARYARDNPSTHDVPIIFLTAMYQTEENVLRGYGSGAVDFLGSPKPWSSSTRRGFRPRTPAVQNHSSWRTCRTS